MPNIAIEDIVLNSTGNAAVIQWLAQESTGIRSPLASDVAANATSFTVQVANWQPPINTLIGIENEVCVVTAKNGSLLTVTRGVGGTAAVIHTAGTMVRELKYQSISAGLRDQIVQFVRSRIRGDAAINASVTAAEATRDAVVTAAVQ